MPSTSTPGGGGIEVRRGVSPSRLYYRWLRTLHGGQPGDAGRRCPCRAATSRCSTRIPSVRVCRCAIGPRTSADDEPLVDRVWRQVRDGLDRERLLPAEEKRIRDLTKRLDRPPESKGWATYVAGQAHTIATGKARNRRNAEVALVEAVSKWTADLGATDGSRLADQHTIVNYGLDHPRKLFNQNQ